jgi:hypothetical protein
MVEIRGAVKELDIVHRLDGRDNLINDFRSPGFRKVGDTFDKWVRHEIFDLRHLYLHKMKVF